jgi:NAD(P)-dependent dehydrogenase (short-subunit alcohol dehydrogenase family)
MRKITSILLLFIGSTTCANTVLITGSNSGIGYELARQYADEGWHVIATHRRDTIPESLVTLSAQYDNVQVETLDVTDMVGIDALAEKLDGVPIDVLLNNAGIVGTFEQPEQQFSTLDYDLFHHFMDTNAAGPLRTAEAFYENVRQSEQKKIVAVSTGFSHSNNVAANGLVTRMGLKNRYWYNMSKAAMNMAYVVLANDMREVGISVALISPGLVRTERTSDYVLNENANAVLIDVETSAENLRKMIRDLTIETSGSYYNSRGVRPW